MKYLFTVVLLIMVITSCGGEKKKTSTPKRDYYEYSEPKQTNQVPESKPGSMEGLNSVSTMSREEDAYEEGRALAEEDRLNKTRQHEGDDYDDDYEDDYDDGYGEED